MKQKQQKREKRDISGWLDLNKPLERRQQRCSAALRFGDATTQNRMARKGNQ